MKLLNVSSLKKNSAFFGMSLLYPCHYICFYTFIEIGSTNTTQRSRIRKVLAGMIGVRNVVTTKAPVMRDDICVKCSVSAVGEGH